MVFYIIVVKGLLELPYWDNPKYSYLLTSNIWQSSVSNIKKFFENKIITGNPNLLKPSIFSIFLKNVDPVYGLFKEYGIEDYITINSFRRGVSRQRSYVYGR